MTLKAISFDLDDTFWPILPVVLRAERVVNGWMLRHYPGVENFLNNKTSTQIRDKLISENPGLIYQLSKLRSEIVLEIGNQAGYNPKEAKKMSKQSFEVFIKARNEVELYDGVEDSLKSLKNKYFLGVITNGNADLNRIGLSHLFDLIISAADVNAGKPDPKIFKTFIKKTGFEPKEICHVGDHPVNDVQASLNVGMKAIWFNEKKTIWPLEIEVDEINSWAELEPLLHQFN